MHWTYVCSDAVLNAVLHFTRFVSLQVADDEYEGLYTVTVEHSFNSGN